ncbi:MAG: alkaline phosphatase D family protein [Bryobacteraceae bacterium]|nr:alkaline phosphatase D family protein [Bryobacteraceae bacterium]MDW8379299.1 alkaline phosphatase D family protein [Bryobacterales bacterium]
MKLNRRQLTRAAITAFSLPANSQTGALQITHGPILGRVGPRSIHIWGRTSSPGPFRVRYGTHPDRMDQISAPVETVFDHDNSAWIEIRDLKPDTRYFYQLVAGSATAGSNQHGGSFRTLPSEDDYRGELNPRGLFNFRFEFGSCNNQKPNQGMGPDLPAFQRMRQTLLDKVHFAILNGDWLYEDKRDFTVEQWQRQTGCPESALPPIVKLAPSIVGVWENYKFFLERGVPMASWHKDVPCYFTPDDHEILNDVYGTGTAGIRTRRAVFRDIAMRAWFDYIAGSNPLETSQPAHFGRARLKAGSDVLTDEATDFTQLDLQHLSNLHVHWGGQLAGVDDPRLDHSDGDPNAGVYQIVKVLDKHALRIFPQARMDGNCVYSIGRHSYGKFRVGNAEFYLLDTRSLRDQHDPKDPYRKGLSMLGQAQRQWLIKSMSSSDADFFFLASSVNLMIPHVGTPGSDGPISGKDDAWTAFVEEREMLIDFWSRLNKPVLVLTGDLHNSFAIRVTDKVWEFCSGPHNSANHPARSEGDRPPNGIFDSRGRKCEIRWSTFFRNDVPSHLRRWPVYAVAQVNNVFSNPLSELASRWVAYPKPHVVIQYFDGRTGDLLYAESVHGEPG